MIKLPKNESLNIVPFIDIMLVLLAIVLSVSTFIAQGKIKIDLPDSSNHEAKNDKESIEIIIDKNNKIYVDNKEVAKENLKIEIEKITNDTPIELKSDKDSAFQSFITVVDILKGKGHENFSITTKKQ